MLRKLKLRGKIILPIGIILVLSVAAIVTIVFVSVIDLTNDLTEERVLGTAHIAQSQLDDLDAQARMLAISAAGSHTVTSNLLNWNAGTNRPQARQALLAYLNATAREVGVDSFVVRDFEGRVVLRMHDPENYGDIDNSAAAAAALGGNTTSSYSSTATMPMGLNATTPIRYNGEIIGTMTPLFFLHEESFVDNFASIFSSHVTIFGGSDGNTRVATTIRTEDGARAIGTDADADVTDIVMGQGRTYLAAISLFGEPYYAYYMPLLGLAGNPVGMFSVAFSNARTANATNALTLTLIIVGVAALVIAVFAALIVANGISKPLAVFDEWMKAITTEGNLVWTQDEMDIYEKQAKRGDEIGTLFESYHHLIEHMTEISDDLQKAADGNFDFETHELSDVDTIARAVNKMTFSLSHLIGEVHITSEEVTTGSQQITDGAQALAQSSTEQSATVEQLSSTVSEITQKTKANYEKAAEASKLAITIKDNAEKGSRQMDEMVGAVNEISQASQSISKVIKVIDDIAFQTNILALNAAVEAARAGQHGKGFAVVAEEVRTLAAKSAEAAKDTGELISNSMEKAEQGARIAKDTAQSLDGIVSGINESSKIIGEIATASEEQTTGISQIDAGIGQVTTTVHQNSATAQETAAATEQLDAQIRTLREKLAAFKTRPAIEGSTLTKSQIYSKASISTMEVGTLKGLSGDRKTYNSGDVIIREGDSNSDCMYFLLEGSVEVFKSYGHPQQMRLAALKPGDLFGEMALFLREQRTASVVAASGVTVLEVRRSEIQRFIENNVTVAYTIVETLCGRLRNLLKELDAY